MIEKQQLTLSKNNYLKNCGYKSTSKRRCATAFTFEDIEVCNYLQMRSSIGTNIIGCCYLGIWYFKEYAQIIKRLGVKMRNVSTPDTFLYHYAYKTNRALISFMFMWYLKEVKYYTAALMRVFS